MVKAQLAFYKAKHGNFVDKAIAWYTNSEFSHVELILNGWWYSTSPRDLEVRRKIIRPNPDRWEFVDIGVDKEHVLALYEKTKGSKYDWLGITLSQFINANIHDSQRWFCSEWSATAMKIPNANRYSPEKLYRRVKEI